MNHLTAIIFIALLGLELPVSLNGQINHSFRITLNTGLKFYNWSEYDKNSTQNLDESGTLFLVGLSATYNFITGSNIYTKSDIYFYTGSVDYDGYLQNDYGTNTPYKTETGYKGVELLLNFGYNFNITHNFILAPELGFEYEYWNRDLGKGDKHGYKETYNVVFMDFGFNGNLRVVPKVLIFMKFLGEIPLSISESVDLSPWEGSGSSVIDLTPGSNVGINFESGVIAYNISLSLYIDYLLFSPSKLNRNIFQPESDRSIFGVKLGYTFYIKI